MKKLALILCLLASPAYAAENIWLFYGAGPHAFSSGIDQIARRARTFSGVGHVGTYDYMDTQRVYDEVLASPPSDTATIVGYSCGGNSGLAVTQGLARNGRPVHLLTMQPSVWCGWYLPTTSNVVYAQNTYAGCIETLGLGCLRLYGDAQQTVNIFRPEPHLRADTDPAYQRDVLRAIYFIANPYECRGHHCHSHTVVIHRPPGGPAQVHVIHGEPQ